MKHLLAVLSDVDDEYLRALAVRLGGRREDGRLRVGALALAVAELVNFHRKANSDTPVVSVKILETAAAQA